MGLGSGIRDPEKIYSGSGDLEKTYFGSDDPGVKKAPDPGCGSATLIYIVLIQL
jgi:hypothetical protein